MAESCGHARCTRGAKRRQRILEAAGGTAPPAGLVQLRQGSGGGRGFARSRRLHAPAAKARRGRSAGVRRPWQAGREAAKHVGGPSRSCRGTRRWRADSSCGTAGAPRTRPHAGACAPLWPTPRQVAESGPRASPPQAEGVSSHAEDAAVGKAPPKGTDVTDGRRPPRPRLPDTGGPEDQTPTCLRGSANTAHADQRHRCRALSRGLEAARLRAGWQDLKQAAASGVDHVTADASAVNLPGNLAAVVPRLQTTRYRATWVRRCAMPKAHGTGPEACPPWKRPWCHWPARSGSRPSTRRTVWSVVTALAADEGRWRRAAPAPATANMDGMGPWETRLAKASSSLWTIRGSWTWCAGASTTGPCSPCCANGGRPVWWTRRVRSSIPRRGRPTVGRSRPSSPMSLCTLPWPSGWQKECNHAGGEQHGCAARRMTGCGPSAGRRTPHGCCACGPQGWRHATAQGPQSQPIGAGAAVCTRARSGASPCGDARFSGPQSGTACPASCGAPHARQLHAACQRLTAWLTHHRHVPGRACVQRLQARCRGHDHDSGVRGNARALHRVCHGALDWTCTGLKRRGGTRSSDTGEPCTRVLDRVKSARPRLTEVPRRRVCA